MVLSVHEVSVGVLLAVVAVFLLAGVVKGVVGLGLPTISMALLALLIAPAQAAALLVVPSLLTNLWQAGPWRAVRAEAGRLDGLLAGCVAGTLAGAAWLGAPTGGTASVVLGLALLAYAAWGLAGRRFLVPRRHEAWMGPLAGLLTGLLTAASGVFVLPAVPYLQGLGLAKDELIRAMGLAFTASTLALAAGLWLNASYDGWTLAASCLMLLPAVAGMQLGAALRARLSLEHFRFCFFLCLAGLGLHMILRQWG